MCGKLHWQVQHFHNKTCLKQLSMVKVMPCQINIFWQISQTNRLELADFLCKKSMKLAYLENIKLAYPEKIQLHLTILQFNFLFLFCNCYQICGIQNKMSRGS